MTTALLEPPVRRATTALSAALATYAVLALVLHPSIVRSSAGALVNLASAVGLVAAVRWRTRFRRLAAVLMFAAATLATTNATIAVFQDRPATARFWDAVVVLGVVYLAVAAMAVRVGGRHGRR